MAGEPNGGYIRVPRGLSLHPALAAEQGAPLSRLEAYLWLLENAAYRDTTLVAHHREVTIGRGQISHSVRFLADAWRWHRNAVQRFLVSLCKSNLIIRECLSGNTRVSREREAGTTPGTATGTGYGTDRIVITLCEYDGIMERIDNPGTEFGTAPGTLPGTDNKEGRRKKKSTLPSGESPTLPFADSGLPIVPTAVVLALPANDAEIALERYNHLAAELRLRPALGLNTDRRAKLRARLRELGGLDGWTAALDKVRESDFIASGRWQSFGLDSLLQPSTLTKLMEGKYRGQWAQQEKAGDGRRAAFVGGSDD